MDVRLPNGILMKNVPEGTTQEDIVAKLKDAGHDVSWYKQADAPRGLLDTAQSAVMNAPGAALKMGEDIVNAVAHPIDTVSALGDMAAGGLRAGVKSLAEGPGQYIPGVGGAAKVLMQGEALYNKQFGSAGTDRAAAAASTVGDHYAGYANREEFLKRIAEDPVAVAMDLSMAAGLLGKGAKAAGMTRAGATLERVGQVTDPLRPVVQGANALANKVAQVGDLMRPERVAAKNLMRASATPTEIPNAMAATQNMPVTPGVTLSLQERMIEAGRRNPEIARLDQNAIDVSTPAGRKAFAQQEQNVAAIQAQLQRVEQQIQTQATTMTPADLSKLDEVRKSLQTNLANEQGLLETVQKSVPDSLPNVSPKATGETLADRMGTLKKDVRENVVNPAYKAAFDAAGGARTPVKNVIDAAEEILGRKLTEYAPETAPSTVRKLVDLSETGATLQDLDAIRKAINLDIRSAASSAAPGAATTLGNLYQLNGAIDDAIQSSRAIPAKAQLLYGEALRKFGEEFAPRFREGEAAQMSRRTNLGRPQLLPDVTVPAFIKNETTAQQFVTTYGKDTAAQTAMRDGVQSAYREALQAGRGEEFLTKNARQIKILDDAGMNVGTAMRKAETTHAKVASDLAELEKSASQFKAKDASAVVDTALKSPMDMSFVRQRLSPAAWDALAAEAKNRAVQLIKDGDAQGALDYLAKHKGTLPTALGAKGAAEYAELLQTAKLQKELADVAKQAPKTGAVAAPLPANLTPAQLTDLSVVAKDIARMKTVDDLARASGSPAGSARRMASEQAAIAGVHSSDIPSLMNPKLSIAKAIAKKIGTVLNAKAIAKLADFMYHNPDAAAKAITDQIARQKARVAQGRKVVSSRVPLYVTGAATTGSRNAMSRDNQNAMSR